MENWEIHNAVAVELSYQQLDSATARLFRLMSVNPGPDVSTAAVAALADHPVGDVRRIIDHLLGAHLVEASAGAADRWRMPGFARLYASQLSDANADVDGRKQAGDRLLRYYLDTASAADARLQTLTDTPITGDFTSREDALAWLDAERPNLVAAVTMAASTGRDEIAMQLPLRLSEYLSGRQRFDDWISTTMISRDAARHVHDQLNEATALTEIGLALLSSDRSEEAITSYQDAAAIFRETGDQNGEGIALDNLGIALGEVGRFEEAITTYQDAAAIFRETGNRHHRGMVLSNLGNVFRKVRRFQEAIAAQQAAVAMFRETGDRYREHGTLENLSATMSAAIIQKSGDRHGEGMAPDSGAAPAKMAIYRETGDIWTRRILFLRTFQNEDFDRMLIVALSYSMPPFSRVVVVGDQQHHDQLKEILDGVSYFLGVDDEDDEDRFGQNIDYVVTSDEAWRATIHAEIGKADCIVLYLSSKFGRIPRANIPSSLDEYFNGRLAQPSTGPGLLYEMAFLQRLGRLGRTLVVVESDDAAQVYDLIHYAEAGDVFRLSRKPLVPRLSALDKQLANLREAGGFLVTTRQEVASPLKSGFFRRLEDAIVEIVAGVTDDSADEVAATHAQLTGRSTVPRRLPPDNQEKIIQYTNVEDLLYIPRGRMVDLSINEARNTLHPQAIKNGCGRCQGPIDDVLFFRDMDSPYVIRGKCQRCGAYQSY
jgi:tetratricopeptide (TPR) repeat protein